MLSESFRKLARRSEPDVQAMRDRFAAHVAGHDAVDFDVATGKVEYKARGRAVWRARAVLLAKLNVELHVFGWWWHGLATWTGSGPLDEIVRAGDREGVTEFHIDAMPIAEEDEAFALAELAGALSEAHGVSFTRTANELAFWVLFDTADSLPPPRSSRPPARATPTSPYGSVRPAPPPSFPPEEGAGRYSITEPPPGIAPVSSRPPARSARGSMPPKVPRAPRMPELPSTAPVSMRPPDGARPSPPSREAFSRIADLSIEAARAAHPEGVRQVLVVASVDPQGGGRRLAVHLVALAHDGKMVNVDVPRELVNAITKLATDAAQTGATRWKRLVARIADDAHGFSFEIEMR